MDTSSTGPIENVRVSPHPITRYRSAIEVAGLVISIGVVIALAAAVVMALNDDLNDGLGDFLGAMFPWGLWITPLLNIGLLLAAAPRLFFRWDKPLDVGMPITTAIFGLVAALFTEFVYVGATITLIARSSDDAYDFDAAEWIGLLGWSVAGISSVILAVVLADLARTSGPERPVARPVD